MSNYRVRYRRRGQTTPPEIDVAVRGATAAAALSRVLLDREGWDPVVPGASKDGREGAVTTGIGWATVRIGPIGGEWEEEWSADHESRHLGDE